MSETVPSDPAARRAAHYDHCAQLVRDADRDSWLASLFAPASMRPHLHALAAFQIEIGRVRELVSAPAPGEIRLQWWVDAIEGETRGDVQAHPIADALIDTISRFKLPRRALTDLVEARRFDLYDDPMPDREALEEWCGHTASIPIRLASLVLADGGEPGGAECAGYAGVAIGLARSLRAFARHAGQGRLYVPVDVLAVQGLTPAAALARPAPEGLGDALAELRALARKRLAQARDTLSRVEPAARAAFLPIACTPLHLDALDRIKAPYDPVPSVPQWRRQWAIWRMARRLG